MANNSRKGELRQAAERVTNTFHITDREAAMLAAHMINAPGAAKDHLGQRRLYRVFEELDIMDLFELITSGPVNVRNFDPVQSKVVTVARDTVDYILEQTNKEMSPAWAITLVPLIDRLKAVQTGTYSLPDDAAKTA